jgi:hypothetical protein
MSGITGIAVTHAGLAPPGYARTAVLNPDSEADPAQLWTTKHPGADGKLEPIVEIAVVYDDQGSAPDGFQVLDTDVNQGRGGGSVFLAFRRRGPTEECAPIVALGVTRSLTAPGTFCFGCCVWKRDPCALGGKRLDVERLSLVKARHWIAACRRRLCRVRAQLEP